jgi:hypothetical protein
VNYRLSFRIFLVVLVSWSVFWAAPATARLFPPVQDVHYNLDNGYTIRYWVTDPASGQYLEETWALIQYGDEYAFRSISSIQVDQGILTWIAFYKKIGDPYTKYYEVHYRIYDPSRGVWKAGSWAFSGDFFTDWTQHLVKDGVVVWATQAVEYEYYGKSIVFFATYDPKLGSWSMGKVPWDHDTANLYHQRLGDLLVKNGVVAFTRHTDKLDLTDLSLQTVGLPFFTTYDYELNLWKSRNIGNWRNVSMEIIDDAPLIQFTLLEPPNYVRICLGYDPTLHDWEFIDPANPPRRAFFISQPSGGVVPFRVWFWDCSTALDGEPTPSSWHWTFALDSTSTSRSPSFLYTSPGQYTVTEDVFYYFEGKDYTATGNIIAQTGAPTGGISINNGATYSTSANVTLSLNYGSSATQMCFRESPGSIWWTPWEPVAPSRNWTLSTLHLIGETPDGPHSVSVKYRDQYATESPVSTASITLDVTPPAVFLTLNSGAATTPNPSVKVDWSASDTVGIAQMHYTSFDEGDSYYHWNLVNFSPPSLIYRPRPSTIKFSSKPGRKTVMVRFTDVAGNITHTQASIELKPAPLTFLPLLLD